MAKQRTLEEMVARDHFAAVMLKYFATDMKLGDRFFGRMGDVADEHYKRSQRQIAEAAYDMADIMLEARKAGA